MVAGGLWLQERLTRLQKVLSISVKTWDFYVWEVDKKTGFKGQISHHQDLRSKLHYQINKDFPKLNDLLEILRLPYETKISHFTVSPGQGHLSLYPTATLLSKSFWMKEQAKPIKGRKSLTYGLKNGILGFDQ